MVDPYSSCPPNWGAIRAHACLHAPPLPLRPQFPRSRYYGGPKPAEEDTDPLEKLIGNKQTDLSSKDRSRGILARQGQLVIKFNKEITVARISIQPLDVWHNGTNYNHHFMPLTLTTDNYTTEMDLEEWDLMDATQFLFPEPVKTKTLTISRDGKPLALSHLMVFALEVCPCQSTNAVRRPTLTL